jgi:nucleotide-binding universal stress UspA family protein
MKRVLLATDGSSHAEAAARFLSCLPNQERLDVVVVTVAQRALSYVAPHLAGQLFEREKVAAAETFTKVEKMLAGRNAAIRHELREGHPGEMIVRAAKDWNADLVLVGARGRSRVSCMLLGCTSDYVATRAECSVLVVRSERPVGSDSRLRIAVGYEDSAPAKAALREMSEIDWSDGVEIHIVAILCCLYGFFGEIPLDSEGGTDSDSTKQLRSALNDAVRQLRDIAPAVKAHLIEHEHIGNGLVKFATDNQCDLMVVGEQPQSTLARALLGSVSRFVLRHAPCSVWIARNLPAVVVGTLVWCS